jgi:hypothetical protein
MDIIEVLESIRGKVRRAVTVVYNNPRSGVSTAERPCKPQDLFGDDMS